MALTDVGVRQARPKEKEYKLSDERGLLLVVRPTGAKWWRLRYRFQGSEKMISLGVYPDVSLWDGGQLAVDEDVLELQTPDVDCRQLVVGQLHVKVLESDVADLSLSGIRSDRTERPETPVNPDQADIASNGSRRGLPLEVTILGPRLND